MWLERLRYNLLYALIAQISVMTIAKAEHPDITDNSNNEISVLVLGFTGETWDKLLIYSVAFAALAAVAVGLTTTASIIAHKAESEAARQERDQYKLEVESKVADARQEGIKAGETAGNAVLRAAQLEKEAALAKLETQKLKKSIAWREISSKTASELKYSLSGRKGTVNILYMNGDPESLYLALQIERVFTSAEWRVGMSSMMPPNSIFFGIGLSTKQDLDTQTVATALASAGLGAERIDVPQGIGFLSSTIADAPNLYVGSKIPGTLRQD